MITKWGLKNFKSIREANLEFAPLTVFTGVNSSGKSSLLQSIGALAQSAHFSKFLQQQFPLFNRASDFISFNSGNNGLVNLGNYDQVFNNKSDKEKENIEIAFSLLSEDMDMNVILGLGCDSNMRNVVFRSFNLDCSEKGHISEFNLNPPNIFMDQDSLEELKKSSLSKYNFKIGKTDGCNFNTYFIHNEFFSPIKIRLKISYEAYEKKFQIFFKILCNIPQQKLSSREEAEKYAESIMPEEVIGGNEIFNIKKKEDGSYDVNKITEPSKIKKYNMEMTNKWFEEFINIDPENNDYYKIMNKLFPAYKDDNGKFKIDIADWFLVMSGLDENDRKGFFLGFDIKLFVKYRIEEIWLSDFDEYTDEIDLPSQLKKAVEYYGNYFYSNIKYLCPLREEPKWISEPFDININPDYREVDFKGSNVAAVIEYHHRKFTQIENYLPPNEFDINKKKKDINFTEALMEWMQYIGFAESFTINEIKENDEVKLELLLKIDGEKYSLPQLGTGVSQVLPVLVMCLTAKPGSTVIIQQPEEQLHPRVQSRLADFIIAMALSGRQCLIETHSEYIIDRIRLRTCQFLLDDKELINDTTKIYYFSKENSCTKITPIEIDKFAAYTVWPDGFFDERYNNSEEIRNLINKKILEESDDDSELSDD